MRVFRLVYVAGGASDYRFFRTGENISQKALEKKVRQGVSDMLFFGIRPALRIRGGSFFPYDKGNIQCAETARRGYSTGLPSG